MRLRLRVDFFCKRNPWVLMGIAAVIPFLCVSGVLSKQNAGGLYHDLFSVSFPTENNGWACGRRGTVLHTADGGKTWIRQNSGTEFTLSAVHFADAENGIAVGHEGTILRTADGGVTWTHQKSPVDFFLMDVQCITPLKAVIVTERTHILLTDNGGKTWSVVFKDNDFILKAVSFCDALNGWAAGEYGFIYHTVDGGTTWQKQGGYCGFSPTTGALVGDKYLFDITAVSPTKAWAVGIDGHMKRTVDGGNTWTDVGYGGPQTQLYFVEADEKGTILVGGKGTLFSSSEKGPGWLPLACDPPVTYGWLYGGARQGSAGFVSVGYNGAIYRSGTKAWQKVMY